MCILEYVFGFSVCILESSLNYIELFRYFNGIIPLKISEIVNNKNNVLTASLNRTTIVSW
jgi:hypothetical protein